MSSSEGGFRASATGGHDVIPDGAKSFIKSLQRSIRNGGSKHDNNNQSGGKQPRNELANLYEEQFNKLTERYFKNSAWPTAEAMAQCIEEDEQILMLYKELYFRHIYAKLTPSVDDKFDSFQNYVDLFNALLGLNSREPEFELPSSWLWDILDEFIYQFQTFHLFRNKVTQLTPDEVSMLKEHEHMWSAQTVLQYLHALVRKAGIDLNKRESEQTINSVGPEDKAYVSPMFKTLGYFSLVGLLRVNTLLCDYPSALKALDPVDLRKDRSMFTGVLACHVTTYYHMGLAYLMNRRYVDAIKVFVYFLSYIQRNKHLIPRSYQADQIQKRVDQMLGLLGIAYVLSGAGNSTSNDRDSASAQLIDDHIYHDVKEKLDEKLTRMKAGDVTAFEEVLSASSPKFLTVSAPNYDGGVDVHTNALQLQLKVFSTEVKQRLNMSELYSYLKLFTSISVSKLAAFLHTDEESAVALLLKLSHKSRSPRWVGGSPSDFIWQQFREVNFTLAGNTVFITEQRQQRNYGGFYLRQIHKFEELTQDVKTMQAARKL